MLTLTICDELYFLLCSFFFLDIDHNLLNLLFYRTWNLHLKSLGARERNRRRDGEGDRAGCSGPALCAGSAGSILKDKLWLHFK